mmetsp:Transcript_60268/g.113718  ORF Transcript_60268/g.113718 Transcript_60268/m.113718 type:complete len:200 (+) Transcript_60268:819-1418(+)
MPKPAMIGSILKHLKAGTPQSLSKAMDSSMSSNSPWRLSRSVSSSNRLGRRSSLQTPDMLRDPWVNQMGIRCTHVRPTVRCMWAVSPAKRSRFHSIPMRRTSPSTHQRQLSHPPTLHRLQRNHRKTQTLLPNLCHKARARYSPSRTLTRFTIRSCQTFSRVSSITYTGTPGTTMSLNGLRPREHPSRRCWVSQTSSCNP